MNYPEGYETVVNRSLTEPVMFAGLPKKFALLLWTFSFCIIIGLFQVWFLAVALLLHFVFVALARRDPLFFEVFLRALGRQKRLVP